MVLYPFAKINIGLRIIGKRSDGFHEIESILYPLREMTDILEIVEEEKFSMHVYGLVPDGDPLSNLCVKAYNLLKRDYDLPPVGIYLYKKIPFGAGLGGGSSDAAFTLILLNRLFELDISVDRLAFYASILGSDCPFFIYSLDFVSGELCNRGMGMVASGRGELLSNIVIPNIEQFYIKVIKPPVFISTAEAYSLVSCSTPEVALSELVTLPVSRWRGAIENDFESAIFRKYPIIAEYKERLYNEGAVYASMSGSGSALFGLFEN